MRRFSNALGVQQGASNALAVANVLVEAIREVRAEGKSERDCPACKLIAHQLAFLLKVSALDTEPLAYVAALDGCDAALATPAKVAT